MSRQNIVSNADTFVKALKEAETNIGVLLMSPDDIVKECDDLGVDDVWKNLPVFKRTINTHLVEVTNDGLTDSTGITYKPCEMSALLDRSLLPMNLTKLPTSIRLVSSNCTY